MKEVCSRFSSFSDPKVYSQDQGLPPLPHYLIDGSFLGWSPSRPFLSAD